MQKNILVIGNGFDLAHGLKTKYSDFMEWVCGYNKTIASNYPKLSVTNMFPNYSKSSLMTYLINCYNNKKSINSWIDLELELKVFIYNLNGFIDFLNNKESEVDEEINKILFYAPNLSYVFLIRQLVSILDNYQTNSTVKKEYIDIWFKIDKQKVFGTINKELIDLRRMLEYYLTEVEPHLHDEIETIDEISKIDPSYVISFNYTDILEKYYNIDPKNICYVHGKIHKNNIVLGYDDSDDSKFDLEFKKYYQRLIYNTNTLEYGRLFCNNEIGIIEQADIYFYGHSLDVSDRDILFRLFAKENLIHIFYVDNDDKYRKIKNLISIIGKDNTIKWITNGKIEFYTSKKKN